MSEVQLWLEVLHRAVLDARLEPESGAITPRQALEVRDARHYLTTSSKDLAAVCTMADIDMVALIERMKLRIAGAADLVVVDRPKVDPVRKLGRSVFYELEGKQLTVRQLSDLSGVSMSLICDRVRKGWPLEAALNPVKMQGQRSAGK